MKQSTLLKRNISRLLSTAIFILAGQHASIQAANITKGDVTTTLWPSGAPYTFFDTAAAGGSDTSANSIDFDRSFGTLNVGSGGTQITVRGIGWASGGSGFTVTNVIVTVTYLGANGTNGGGDDVLIGKTTNNVTADTTAGEWVWVFDQPMTNIIDGVSNMFRVNMTRVGTGTQGFKSLTAGVWSTVKLSVAGSTTAVGAGNPLARKWVGGIDGTWDTGTLNWSDGVNSAAYADGKNVTLDDTLSVSPLNNYITLADTYSPSNIVVNNTLYDYHLSGGSLAGAMTLTKQGTNRFSLGMSNAYTGVTTINAGILEVDDANALGSTSGGTVVNSGGALVLNNGITLSGEPITLNGTGNNLGALHTADSSSPVTVASPITLGSDNTRIQTGIAYGQVILTGPITDNGNNYNLNLNSGQGSSSLRIDTAGNTVISNVTLYSYLPPPSGGSIIFGVNDAFPSARLLTGGGLFDLNGTSQKFAGLDQGFLPKTGVIINSSATPSTLTLDVPAGANRVAQTPIQGNVNIVKDGPGAQALGGGVINTYTGTTTINGGILGFASDMSGVTGDFIVNSGGTLRGIATLGGSVNVHSGGTFYAGYASNALGTLTINGNLTLDSGSTTIAAINPDLSPSNDVVNVSGTLTYGGTLVVYSIGHTSALAAGETFRIFPPGGSGSFSTIIFNSIETQPGTMVAFDDGQITVTSTSAPSVSVASLGGGVMQIDWNSSFYKLQWQTDTLETGLSANWTDYPTTNKATVTITNDLAVPATFFRLAPKP